MSTEFTPPWALDAAPVDETWNTTDWLGRLFDYGVKNSPNRIAISDGKSSFSFQDLDDLSWRIAVQLSAMGVRPGNRVAVIASKSSLMPPICVAIWKCGGVYVPLDQDSPPARLNALIDQIAPKCIVCCETNYQHTDIPVISNEEIVAFSKESKQPKRFIIPKQHKEEVAYIIFTSGSTGQPKGVEITYHNLLSYFRSHNVVLQFTENSRVLSFAPFHFDVSIEDTLLPLSLGAYSYQYRGIYAGTIIRKVLASQNITHLIAVSTILTLISTPKLSISAKAFPRLEMVMTGAEVCDPKIINYWVEALPNCRVINAYGPTETTIVCFCYHIKSSNWIQDKSFPIGKPLDNVEFLLIDEEGKPSPIGTPGELCIGGPLVMRGYLNQMEITRTVIFDYGGVRYYRTGDICTLLSDGMVEYIGRRDDEVKINGKRIHLGEIRQKAISVQGVDRIAIGTIERLGRKEIIIVVIATDTNVINHVRKYITEQFPFYMRPSVWVRAESTLFSSTGKTDEKKLLVEISKIAVETSFCFFEISKAGDIQVLKNMEKKYD